MSHLITLLLFLAFALSAPASAQPENLTLNSWAADETKSPVDDSPQATAMNIASTQTLSSDPQSLILRCREHKTYFYVTAGLSWGIFFGGEGIRVLYRINDKPAQQEVWHKGSSGSAAFYPKDAIAFARSIPDQGKIFIRVTDSSGGTHDQTFSLVGFTEARDKVATACKWPKSR